MARRIRHVYAGRNEWVRVHRSSGGDSLGGLMLLGVLVLFFGGTWIGVLLFLWLVVSAFGDS